MTYRVAIVGRPNVGKSTLFNRLAGKRLALVDDTPGVTRDRREGWGEYGTLRFQLFDTAGFEEGDEASLFGRMRKQTLAAIDDADLCLFLIDARAGVTPLDKAFADILRKSPKPVALLANKCEGAAAQAGLYEAFALGLGEPLAVSAEHGEGISDLYDILLAHAPEGEAAANEEDDEGRPLHLAIIGRPNVGKSTLINRLLGQERVITGPEAGLTRDTIAIDWAFEDRAVRLFDTAGLRRQARITEKLEKMSAGDTLRAIKFADIVVLLVDAEHPFDKQDLLLASHAVDEGRGLILAVNKWDRITDKKTVLAKLKDVLDLQLPQVRGVPVVTLSARTGQGVAQLMPQVIKVHQRWTQRIPTSPLNQWLGAALDRHPPPASDGRYLKLRYVTQVKSRPPTLALFANKPGELPQSYKQYLLNDLRQNFDLAGVPVRIMLRKGKNPYEDKD